MPDPSSDATPSALRRLGLPMLSGSLTGAVFAWMILHADGAGRPVGWFLLVLVTLALLPLGDAQRRMHRAGRISSATMPRPAAYRSAALQWLVLGALAVWVVQGNAAPFDASAYALPDGAEGLMALVVVALLLGGLARWGRSLRQDRRRRAWLRAHHRFGASLIAPRTEGELRQFRAMVALTSTAEEITYRLAVPGGFLLLWGGAQADAPSTMWFAAALSALLFGVAHAWQGAWAIAWTTAFGLVAAALTLGSGSVWPAVAMHIGWNLIAGDMMRAVYGSHQRRGASCRGGAATS